MSVYDDMKMWQGRPKETNGDRIRAMSNEDMASAMARATPYCVIEKDRNKDCQHDCYKCRLAWLNKEADDV